MGLNSCLAVFTSGNAEAIMDNLRNIKILVRIKGLNSGFKMFTSGNAKAIFDNFCIEKIFLKRDFKPFKVHGWVFMFCCGR